MSLRTTSEIQRDYYRRTAAAYDDLHVAGYGEHEEALLHVAAYIRAMHARSVLDVGAGTGRALSFLRGQLAPDVRLPGIEPVPELIAQARSKGIGPETLSEGDGASLPFADGEFDVVLETGVLHHVAEPARVLADVMRVARRAIFVSDSSRFGQGPLAARLMKLGLCRMGLWRAFTLVRTRGRGYMVSEGDGLFYSYRVYDNLEQISRWADRLLWFPPGAARKAASTVGSAPCSLPGRCYCARSANHLETHRPECIWGPEPFPQSFRHNAVGCDSHIYRATGWGSRTIGCAHSSRPRRSGSIAFSIWPAGRARVEHVRQTANVLTHS